MASDHNASTTRSHGVDSSATKGSSVVRFDNRDVGLSSKLDGIDYSLADMADDAIAVLDAIGCQKAHVMGCSHGQG